MIFLIFIAFSTGGIIGLGCIGTLYWARKIISAYIGSKSNKRPEITNEKEK